MRSTGKLVVLSREQRLMKLELDDYLRLRADGTVIERDLHGEKVIRLPDGNMLKLFRRKRLLSSAMFYPYAQRFADNCVKLKHLGIACPQAIAVFRVAGIGRDVVHYHPLPGQTVRQLITSGLEPQTADSLREQLGCFIALLHRKGVYFRSLHLGNIVLTPNGELGLIDIADLNVRRSCLMSLTRGRNMKHLQRYRDDYAWLTTGQYFAEAYRTALSGEARNSAPHP